MSNHRLILLLPLIFIFACDNKELVAPQTNLKIQAEDAKQPIPKLVRDDGTFELVSVIEGTSANHRFHASLKLVEKQRSLLESKKDTLKGGEDLDLSQEIEDLNKLLESNMTQMSTTYGYSSSFNYILVPLESDLYEISKGGSGRSLAQEIRGSAGYDRLQALRSKYEQAAEHEPARNSISADLAKKLKTEFNFDVKSNYTLDIRKSALYKRVH